MNPVRCLATLALALLAPAALAQQSLYEEKTPTLEAGVRYWVSKGSMERSHDASGFNCDFGSGFVFPCGKPTSTLNYDNLGAHSLELFARKSLASGWFVKGNLGLGVIPNGRLIDQDFVNPPFQDLASETVSGLAGKMYYGSIDIGRETWKSKAGDSTLGLFVGYQRWNEQLDAYGYMSTENSFLFDPTPPGENVPVIRNEQVWDAARIGAEIRMVRGRTRATLELAYVPYAQYKNTDNHWLRSDLDGPIVAKGRGHGYQLELELRRRFPEFFDLELGLGYRYWVLTADTGSSTFGSDPRAFPISDLSSERQGVMFSVGKSW